MTALETTAPLASSSLVLYADDAGRGGLPIVFLHSSAGSSRHFDGQLTHARKTRRAIALDLRGHGKSPTGASFDVGLAAGDVLETLDRLDVSRFVVVGHSWGGAVATAVAGRAPSRVAGLLLLDPASDGRKMPAPVAEGLMRSLETDYTKVVHEYWESMLGGSKPEVHARLMNEIDGAARATVVGTLASLLTFDPVTPLESYRGLKHTVITRLNEGPDAYQNLVANLPSSRIEGTGHWLQLDAPDEVNARIDAFLREIV